VADDFILGINSPAYAPTARSPFEFEVRFENYLEGVNPGDNIWLASGSFGSTKVEILRKLGNVRFHDGDDGKFWIGDPFSSFATTRHQARGIPSVEIDNGCEVIFANSFFTFWKISNSEIQHFTNHIKNLPNAKFGASLYPNAETLSASLGSKYPSIASLRGDISRFVRRNFALDEIVFDAFIVKAIPEDPFDFLAELFSERLVELNLVSIGQPTLPRVSIELEEIVVPGISARVWGTMSENPDGDIARQLLERAEAAHQQILKEVCTVLRDFNVVPYQSRSIDLYFSFSFSSYIAEIKSATKLNFEAQLESGLIQILRYGFEFSRNHQVSPLIILEDFGLSLDAKEEFSAFCEYLNVSIVFWRLGGDTKINQKSLFEAVALSSYE